MKQLIKLSSLMLVAIGLLVGCGSSGSSTEKSDASKSIPIERFDSKTGTVTEETTLTVGESKSTETTVVIPKSTTFVSDDKEPITEVPVLNAKTEKSKKGSSTEIGFVTADGKKVIPTEPVAVSVPAPKGAKPGDTVQVEIPDSAKVAKMQKSNSDGTSKRVSKMVFVTVSANGTITILIDFSGGGAISIVVTIVDGSTN